MAARLYVTCGAVKSTVAVIDTAAGKIVDSIPAGHTAHGVAVTPDGKRLYVCNRFNNDVSVIEAASHKQIARVAVTREPTRPRPRPTASRSSWSITCRWTGPMATTWRPTSA